MSVTTATTRVLRADSGRVRLEVRETSDKPFVHIVLRDGDSTHCERWVGTLSLDDLEGLFDAAGQLVTHYENAS